MPTLQHRRKSGLFVPAELADGEIGINRAAGRLEFNSNGAIQPVVSVPSGGTTGQVLTKSSGTDYAALWQTPSIPKVQEIPFSFNADGAGYYVATVACTVGSPSTVRGTGSVAWAYSTDGATFSAATFPLSMAANSILRATVTGCTTYLGVTLQRT